MKPRHLLLAAAVLSATSFVNATPVKYEFVGTHFAEVNATDLSLVSDYLFTDGTVVNASFFYDSNTPALLSNQVDSGDLQPFGLLSIYANSTSNISGSIDGYSFSADTGTTIVGNSNVGDATFLDGVFNIAGTINGDVVGTGFSGFELNGYTLTSSNIFSVGFNDYLADQSLPATLTNGPLNTGLNLIFADANHNERIVQFFGGDIKPVASVPEPSPLWLLMAGMLGLFGFSRYRKI